MADLTEALDELATEDLYDLPARNVLERIRRLVAAQNRLAAELARTVRRAELAQACEHDGLRTMAAWLRGHARLSPAAAGQLVRNGRALEQLPALADAATGGQVTGEAVAVVSQVVKPENLALAQAQGVGLGGIEAALVEVAVSRPHADLVKVVAHYLARLDQDGPEPDPTQQRSLTLVKHADGSLSGRFELDAVGGEKLQTALESIVQANRPAGDERSRAQRLADALVQLVDNQLAFGHLPQTRTVKPQLLVTVGLADLLDPALGPTAAEAGFGATLSAARARWAACDAQVTRIVLDPDGLPLDVGRTQRLVPAHIRRAVELRDRGCIFAGCHAPTWWCDTHHKIEWALGGKTSLENSALLCERHHTQVHHGFRINAKPTAGTPTAPMAPRSSSRRKWRRLESRPHSRGCASLLGHRGLPSSRSGARRVPGASSSRSTPEPVGTPVDTVSRVQLTVVDHPLARARLSRMRDERTDNANFRAALRDLTQMLMYEATRDLKLAEGTIRTPVSETTGYEVAEPPLIVPVLRAGLGMADTAHRMLPESQMGFVGLARNEETFQPEAYMASLPASLVGREVFVLDPMLATGGSLVHCCGLLTDRGATSITVLCALAAPEGLRRLEESGLPLRIFTASVDEGLNAKAYIVPGLGDAGDRQFGAV